MNLVGNLEDLPLSDILQIVNLSRQTGTLEITVEDALRCVVFRQGKVIDVGTPGSLARALQLLYRRGLLEEEEAVRLQREPEAQTGHWADRVLAAGLVSAPLLAQAREEWIKSEIAQLLELTSGDFVFRLNAENSAAAASAPAPAHAVTPQIVTGSTVSFEERAPEPPPPPAPPPPPEPPPRDLAYVTDPEPLAAAAPDHPVRTTRPGVPTRPPAAPGEPYEPLIETELVAAPRDPDSGTPPAPRTPYQTPVSAVAAGELTGHQVAMAMADLALSEALHRVLTAGGAHVTRLSPEQTPAWLASAVPPSALIVDAPLNGGGGIELAREAERTAPPGVQVVTLIPTGAESLLARAGGLREVLIRPDSSRLPLGELSRQLGAFGREVAAKLTPPPEVDEFAELTEALGAEPAEPQSVAVRDPMSMLRGLVGELRSNTSAEITLLVLRLAAEYLERAVLLVVAGEELHGLGGFGSTGVGAPMATLVRGIRARLHDHPVLAALASDPAGWRGPLGPEHEVLISELGTLRPAEGVFIPITSRGRIFALLYGDNAQSGAPLGDLAGLEIFAAQAGITMENAMLERELTRMKRDSA